MKMIKVRGVEISQSIMPVEARSWVISELNRMDLEWPGREEAVAELEELEEEDLEIPSDGPYEDLSVASFLIRARLEYGSDSHYSTVESGPDESVEIFLDLSLEDSPEVSAPTEETNP